MQRLLPDAAETTVADEVAALDFVARAHDERPYTVTNFVLTLDGRATIAGRSGPIGSEADTAMLVGLRTRVDAVMIGAHVVLVSGRLDLPWDAPLFTEGAGEVVICTAADIELPETATPVHVVRHAEGIDLAALVKELRAEHAVRALLCEGGPNLHAQLIDAGLVDELFVTHAPKLAGGAGPGLVEGLTEHARELELISLLHEETSGELFARYRVPESVGT
jgi:riboflavin biosynthesis pyrimidine reductase